MGDAHVAPKESKHPQRPPQDVTWADSNKLGGDRLVKMKKEVQAAIEQEKAKLAGQEQATVKVALESVRPGTPEQTAILQQSKEAQARLISRLVQTQLMGEFLQIAREQVNWRSLIDKSEQDPLFQAALDIMADHIAGPGIYVTADNDFAKDVVEEFFEKVNMESLIREAGRDIHGYGLHIWHKYQNAFTKQLTDLRIIPLESIYRVHRDDRGNWVTMHQMPEYYGEPVEAGRLVIFKWRPINQNAFGSGIAQVMYISRRYSLVIRDNTTGQTLSTRSIIVPSQFDGRTMLYDIMLKVFQRYGMPYQAFRLGSKDEPVDQNLVETLVKPSIKRREEIVINKPIEIVSDEIDPRTRFEAYMNEITNLNIVTMQTPILKLWAAPEGMTEASARTALKAFDRIVLSKQRFIKRIIEREVIPLILKSNAINPEEANVRMHFGPIDKPDLAYIDLINIFKLNDIAIKMWNAQNPTKPEPLQISEPKRNGEGPGVAEIMRTMEQFGKPMGPAGKPFKGAWVITVAEFRQNLRRFGIDLEEHMPGEEEAQPQAAGVEPQ